MSAVKKLIEEMQKKEKPNIAPKPSDLQPKSEIELPGKAEKLRPISIVSEMKKNYDLLSPEATTARSSPFSPKPSSSEQKLAPGGFSSVTSPRPLPKPKVLGSVEEQNQPTNVQSATSPTPPPVTPAKPRYLATSDAQKQSFAGSPTPMLAPKPRPFVKIEENGQPLPGNPVSATPSSTTVPVVSATVSSPKIAPKPLPKSRNITVRDNTKEITPPSSQGQNSIEKSPSSLFKETSQNNSVISESRPNVGSSVNTPPVSTNQKSGSDNDTTSVIETVKIIEKPSSPPESKVLELRKAFNNTDKLVPKPESKHNSLLSVNQEKSFSKNESQGSLQQLNFDKEGLTKKIAELEAELNTAKAQTAILQSQLDSSKVNHKLELESVKERHKEEIEKVRIEVAGKKDEEYKEIKSAMDGLKLQNDTLKLLLDKSNNDKAALTRQIQDSESSISTLKNSFISQKAELDSLRKTNADLNFVIAQVSPTSSEHSKKRSSTGPGTLEFTPPVIKPQPHNRAPSQDKKATTPPVGYSASQPNLLNMSGSYSTPNSATASPATSRRQKSFIPPPPPLSSKKGSLTGLSNSPSLTKLAE